MSCWTTPAFAPRSYRNDNSSSYWSLPAFIIGHITEGHARVNLNEVKRHLDATYFAWIGGTDAAGVFIIASTARGAHRVR